MRNDSHDFSLVNPCRRRGGEKIRRNFLAGHSAPQLLWMCVATPRMPCRGRLRDRIALPGERKKCPFDRYFLNVRHTRASAALAMQSERSRQRRGRTYQKTSGSARAPRTSALKTRWFFCCAVVIELKCSAIRAGTLTISPPFTVRRTVWRKRQPRRRPRSLQPRSLQPRRRLRRRLPRRRPRPSASRLRKRSNVTVLGPTFEDSVTSVDRRVTSEDGQCRRWRRINRQKTGRRRRGLLVLVPGNEPGDSEQAMRNATRITKRQSP